MKNFLLNFIYFFVIPIITTIGLLFLFRFFYFMYHFIMGVNDDLIFFSIGSLILGIIITWYSYVMNYTLAKD